VQENSPLNKHKAESDSQDKANPHPQTQRMEEKNEIQVLSIIQ
jgi:hypothetical protein